MKWPRERKPTFDVTRGVSAPQTFAAYPGLEVVFRTAVSPEFAIKFQGTPRPTTLAEMHEAITMFGDVGIERWNLIQDGQAVPPTGAGVASINDIALVTEIVTRWKSLIDAKRPVRRSAPSRPHGLQRRFR